MYYKNVKFPGYLSTDNSNIFNASQQPYHAYIYYKYHESFLFFSEGRKYPVLLVLRLRVILGTFIVGAMAAHKIPTMDLLGYVSLVQTKKASAFCAWKK